MLLILPVSFEYYTTLSPKKVLRKLDGELVEYKPTLNVLSTGKFMKKYKTECVFYGRHEGDNFQIFYHKAGKRDGGETGFYGTIEKTESGSRIYGKFRKPKYTYVFGIIWVLLTLLCVFGALAGGSKTGALVCLGVCIAGVFLLFWDNKKKFILEYLRDFPEDVPKE